MLDSRLPGRSRSHGRPARGGSHADVFYLLPFLLFPLASSPFLPFLFFFSSFLSLGLDRIPSISGERRGGEMQQPGGRVVRRTSDLRTSGAAAGGGEVRRGTEVRRSSDLRAGSAAAGFPEQALRAARRLAPWALAAASGRALPTGVRLQRRWRRAPPGTSVVFYFFYFLDAKVFTNIFLSFLVLDVKVFS